MYISHSICYKSQFDPNLLKIQSVSKCAVLVSTCYVRSLVIIPPLKAKSELCYYRGDSLINSLLSLTTSFEAISCIVRTSASHYQYHSITYTRKWLSKASADCVFRPHKSLMLQNNPFSYALLPLRKFLNFIKVILLKRRPHIQLLCNSWHCSNVV